MKKKKILIILLLLFFALILGFFRYGGELLVVEDDIEDVDHAVIVLLMGSVADRSLGAAELYEEGKGDSILIVRSHITGNEVLQERGISIPGDAERSKIVLSELGVAEEDLTILPGSAESTKDEALVIAEYLEGGADIDSILLVTSKYHSYRSKIIFNKALEELDVAIYSAPTPYDPYESKGWYRDREDIQRVATEYMKLAHYFLLERFQMR
ncbi:YdcF family protein [Oceanobacillus rekensis]|uniref:YdcF family protein n=1 Tax=Oceanobacillus rekensis TaxID=937927 RepID=UPI000B433751|nr:YdcF family protein [Oceanobacillus rekensis]